MPPIWGVPKIKGTMISWAKVSLLWAMSSFGGQGHFVEARSFLGGQGLLLPGKVICAGGPGHLDSAHDRAHQICDLAHPKN